MDPMHCGVCGGDSYTTATILLLFEEIGFSCQVCNYYGTLLWVLDCRMYSVARMCFSNLVMTFLSTSNFLFIASFTDLLWKLVLSKVWAYMMVFLWSHQKSSVFWWCHIHLLLSQISFRLEAFQILILPPSADPHLSGICYRDVIQVSKLLPWFQFSHYWESLKSFWVF